MITYEWDFPRFQTRPSQDGLSDVVYNIEYVLTGHDGEGHGHQLFGNVDVGAPEANSFKPFRLLTQKTVESWVIDALGEELLADLKEIILNQIETQKIPASITLNRPW